MRLPFIKRKVTRGPCYFIVVHFPSAEQAAAFTNTTTFPYNSVRMLRGGEKLPMCEEEA